jgi:hypothetical protein
MEWGDDTIVGGSCAPFSFTLEAKKSPWHYQWIAPLSHKSSDMDHRPFSHLISNSELLALSLIWDPNLHAGASWTSKYKAWANRTFEDSNPRSGSALNEYWVVRTMHAGCKWFRQSDVLSLLSGQGIFITLIRRHPPLLVDQAVLTVKRVWVSIE